MLYSRRRLRAARSGGVGSGLDAAGSMSSTVVVLSGNWRDDCLFLRPINIDEAGANVAATAFLRRQMTPQGNHAAAVGSR
jgi:hypothetical protein